ncbi:hypothetical protein NDS46_31565 (plasmid) [Paenibacillus thiaminolyticus]|uniref:hypothetical protein n=1 Tax=Paenibacillus thiaminolyticus TaxID=49283 RepID=UPI00232DF50D|nr:hypothetical protein [Paenibacillus thiaminolyticus]WCF11497.1 hypothetical protein NDS46_31565 [Paenibacillus thiaminolyticus]
MDNKKSLIVRIIIFIILVLVLNWFKNRIAPMILADSALLQLNDSDTAYAQFTAIQDVIRYFWVTYPLAFILVFYSFLKKLFKKPREVGGQADD